MFEMVRWLLTGKSRPAPGYARSTPGFRQLAFWRRTPRPIPAHLMQSGPRVQLPGDGHGPLFHRRYTLDFAGAQLGVEELMGRVKADVGAFSPQFLAHFEKSKGNAAEMRPGDEYHISILGPWNGTVRVVEVTPSTFTLVTLDGHPEAGEIMFSLEPHPERPDALRFEICSWARSRDMLVGLTYKEAGVGKEVQKNAWATFCERVAEASGGRPLGPVSVVTEEQEFEREVIPVE